MRPLVTLGAVALLSLFFCPEQVRAGDEPAPKKIQGLSGPNRWGPAEVPVQPGDVVEWSVAAGFHGVMFPDWNQAKMVLEPTGGLPVEMQEGFAAPAQGTAGKGVGVLLLRAKVKKPPKGVTEVPFFCTVHGKGMSGNLKLGGAAGGKVTINGVAPMKWDPAMVTAKEGDVVEWVSKTGFHGVVFSDFDKAKEVLKIDADAGLPIKAQDGFPAPAQGTDGAAAGTLLVRAKVQALSADKVEVPFVCTVHGATMSGKLVLMKAGEAKKDKPKDSDKD